VDITLFIGTIGLFLFLFLLFVRFLPMITMFEVKNVTPEADPHHGNGHDTHGHASHSSPAKAHA
jgi:molybdopterin-containing oxidoreductase family membrane subunit